MPHRVAQSLELIYDGKHTHDSSVIHHEWRVHNVSNGTHVKALHHTATAQSLELIYDVEDTHD